MTMVLTEARSPAQPPPIIAEDAAADAAADEAFLTINDVPVRFSEDWNAGIGGGLWSTGLAMAKYFQHHGDDAIDGLKRLARAKSSRRDRDRRPRSETNGEAAAEGISALELGSGNGFLSVCLLALVADRNDVPLEDLAVTDMADHLDLMATTLRANPHVWDRLTVIEGRDGHGGTNDETEATAVDGTPSGIHTVANRSNRSTPTEVIVTEHVWGQFPPERPSDGEECIRAARSRRAQSKKYDFIFGTDLAYRNSLHEPLIESLSHFSHQQTVCLIGVTMTDTQPAFFDSLTRAGFRYEKLADHLLEREFRGGNFGIIAVQRR